MKKVFRISKIEDQDHFRRKECAHMSASERVMAVFTMQWNASPNRHVQKVFSSGLACGRINHVKVHGIVDFISQLTVGRVQVAGKKSQVIKTIVACRGICKRDSAAVVCAPIESGHGQDQQRKTAKTLKFIRPLPGNSVIILSKRPCIGRGRGK